MNVSEFIWECLADHGVKHVPFLPGGGSMYLVDALIRNKRLIPVCFLHEQAATVAADAIAQYSGGLGVVCVTSGPGATNTITAVASSWVDSVPLLVISGQCATHQRAKPGERQGGPQEVDITKIVRPITKVAAVARQPSIRHGFNYTEVGVTVGPSIPQILHYMVREALSNPSGPVWLDVPLDVQSAEI